MQEKVSWGWAGKQWLPQQWIKYKLTDRAWKALWVRQGGRCAGCREEFAHPLEKEMRFGLKPETDHRHREGEQCEAADVRGLLCGDCNRFLGKIKDNRVVLTNLLAYLRAHGEEL
jgi:hypothetical protein